MRRLVVHPVAKLLPQEGAIELVVVDDRKMLMRRIRTRVPSGHNPTTDGLTVVAVVLAVVNSREKIYNSLQ